MNLAAPSRASLGTPATVGLVRRLTRRLLALMVVILVLASASIAYLTLAEFNRLLQPELGKKAQLIGQIVAADIERALDYGIPLQDLSASASTSTL